MDPIKLCDERFNLSDERFDHILCMKEYQLFIKLIYDFLNEPKIYSLFNCFGFKKKTYYIHCYLCFSLNFGG